MRPPRVLPVLPVLAALLAAFVHAAPPAARTIHVFDGEMIHFLPDSSARYASGGVEIRDNGRRIRRRIDLGRAHPPERWIAHLVIQPVPKTEASVCDPWDRAGSIRLVADGSPDLEIVKFMTSYGGRTVHAVDVTELAPSLTGEVTIEAFIDTWVTPAWRVDFRLESRPALAPATPLEASFDSAAVARGAAWVLPLWCVDDWTAARNDSLAAPRPFKIPAGTRRVVLRLLTSGHCTDGRDDDEFVTKEHRVTVDGREAARFRPWRDDCRRFRDLNPYGRRWSDGSWSSDYARSGWCPGETVSPREFDLTGSLGPGAPTIALAIAGIRPAGEDGHQGYWRVSAALVGYR